MIIGKKEFAQLLHRLDWIVTNITDFRRDTRRELSDIRDKAHRVAGVHVSLRETEQRLTDLIQPKRRCKTCGGLGPIEKS